MCTAAAVTSAPGSLRRTPLPSLRPGVTWCHRHRLSASVTPRASLAMAISAPARAKPPAVTEMALSSSRTASPPARGWCGTRSRKGTSAKNASPVVRFFTHTARARTTPSAHRKSSLVCVPEPVSPGLRAHRPEAWMHMPIWISSAARVASARYSACTSAAYVPAMARSVARPSAGERSVRRYGPHLLPSPMCSLSHSCSRKTARPRSGSETYNFLRCSPTEWLFERMLRAVTGDNVSDAGTRRYRAPPSTPPSSATSPRPSPGFPGTRRTRTPCMAPPLSSNQVCMAAYASSMAVSLRIASGSARALASASSVARSQGTSSAPSFSVACSAHSRAGRSAPVPATAPVTIASPIFAARRARRDAERDTEGKTEPSPDSSALVALASSSSSSSRTKRPPSTSSDPHALATCGMRSSSSSSSSPVPSASSSPSSPSVAFPARKCEADSAAAPLAPASPARAGGSTGGGPPRRSIPRSAPMRIARSCSLPPGKMNLAWSEMLNPGFSRSSRIASCRNFSVSLGESSRYSSSPSKSSDHDAPSAATKPTRAAHVATHKATATSADALIDEPRRIAPRRARMLTAGTHRALVCGRRSRANATRNVSKGWIACEADNRNRRGAWRASVFGLARELLQLSTNERNGFRAIRYFHKIRTAVVRSAVSDIPKPRRAAHSASRLTPRTRDEVEVSPWARVVPRAGHHRERSAPAANVGRVASAPHRNSCRLSRIGE